MIHKLTVLFAVTALAGAAIAAEKSLALKDLPPAVQKTVTDKLKHSVIRNIGQETGTVVAQY
jgi:hypothetical protein